MSETTEIKTIRSEWWLLTILASIQFTNLMDFVILMPLGPQLMRVFSISPQQFGMIVSGYTFSAGVVGLLGAMVIDRFDRKKILLILYAGFATGNLLCALSPTFEILLAARVVTGAFGGILGAIVFAIVGDVIPDMRRGKAIGTIMASFSLATVAGVPVGLFLANSFGWHIPFFMLAGTSSAVLITGYFVLPSMRGHLAHRSDISPVHSLLQLLNNRSNINSFIFMSAMMFAGFSVIPYISPYLVSNTGMPESDLPYVYLLGGAATMFTSRYFGKLSDTFGKQRTFVWIAGLSMIPVLILTNLPSEPLWIVLLVTTVFMILVSGRMVPAMAMVTASVEPKQRGSFMSVNSSIQQFSSGIASFGAGVILGTSASGAITRYWIVGILAALTSVLCILLSRNIQNVETQNDNQPVEAVFETV
jgi:predicted MFS family arabinose efflux permease